MLHRSLAFPKRTLAAGALLLAAPALTSCGFNYATDKIYTPGHGANNRDADVDVLGAVIVSSTPGSGTFVASLSNNQRTEADQLTGLAGEVTVPAAKTVRIPGGALVNLATKGGIKVSGDFQDGDFVTVVLSFANSEQVEVEVPVVPNDDYFAGLDGEPSASPTDEHGEEPADEHGETPATTAPSH